MPRAYILLQIEDMKLMQQPRFKNYARHGKVIEVEWLHTADQMRAYALSAISAHEAEVGRLRKAGSLLSNAAFNLSQTAGRVLSERDANSLKQAQLQWDAALTQGETK